MKYSIAIFKSKHANGFLSYNHPDGKETQSMVAFQGEESHHIVAQSHKEPSGSYYFIHFLIHPHS